VSHPVARLVLTGPPRSARPPTGAISSEPSLPDPWLDALGREAPVDQRSAWSSVSTEGAK
jgi:hypothetical protein